MEVHGSPINAITAFILAGGKSTRMGSDKAFIQLHGKTLLEYALQAARSVTSEVIIVGQKSKFALYAPVVEDVFEQRGPLGGIHAGLEHATTDLNLFLAGDLPFIHPAFLDFLCARARGNDALVTIPRAAGGWQPLCAVYRKEFAKLAKEALQAGQNKIDPLFAHVPIAILEENEITAAGFALNMFRNVNTPEELHEASQ